MAVDHTVRAHALLSASGASRWLNCTPSARLEEKYDASSGSSSYAAEGTLAHEFGDITLRYKNGEIDTKLYNRELKKLRKNPLYTDEMEEQVDKYVVYVMELLSVARSKTKDAKLLIEERFDFSEYVEKGFGTGDASIVADRVLDICDLKYGKGVKVEAKANPQGMLYALGALKSFDMMFDIHTVRIHIMQPRLDHISVYEISVEELTHWGKNTVKPVALKAYQGKGVQQAGVWCKFCKVKAMCATLAAKNVKLAQYEFKDPHLLTDKQLLDVFKQQPMLADWVSAVSKHILKEAKAGKQWPGYKIVEGKSNRKWTDEEGVKKVLQDELFEEKDYLQTKLHGITAIEKLVGRAEFSGLLGNYYDKPQGAATLVPETDTRPAMGIAQAKEDFK